jgi:serine/threonine protein kinase
MKATIGNYEIITDWDCSGAGRCQYAFARREGREYFVKRFLTPKFPSDKMSKPARDRQTEICRKFEDRTNRIIKAVSTRTASGGNLVAPVDFFREGLTYYKFFERLDPSAFDYNHIIAGELKEKIFFAKTAASALRVLHSDDIVHSDLKPQNIILDKTKTGKLIPKIVDFDDGYFASEPPETADTLVGDPLYYSPEMLAYVKTNDAETRGKLTTKSDIFALGLIFYEIFSGEERPSFGKEYGSAAHYVRDRNVIAKLSEVPLPQIETLLVEMLAAKPALRPDCYGVYSRLRTLEDALAKGKSASLGAPIVIRTIKPKPPISVSLPRVLVRPISGKALGKPVGSPTAVRPVKPPAKTPSGTERSPPAPGPRSLVRPIKPRPKG